MQRVRSLTVKELVNSLSHRCQCYTSAEKAAVEVGSN